MPRVAILFVQLGALKTFSKNVVREHFNGAWLEQLYISKESFK